MVEKKSKSQIALDYLDSQYGNLVCEYEHTTGNVFCRYLNENNLPIFVYDRKQSNDNVYVLKEEIWDFLKNFFGMDDLEIITIINYWIRKTYDIFVNHTQVKMI